MSIKAETSLPLVPLLPLLPTLDHHTNSLPEPKITSQSRGKDEPKHSSESNNTILPLTPHLPATTTTHPHYPPRPNTPHPSTALLDAVSNLTLPSPLILHQYQYQQCFKTPALPRQIPVWDFTGIQGLEMPTPVMIDRRRRGSGESSLGGGSTTVRPAPSLGEGGLGRSLGGETVKPIQSFGGETIRPLPLRQPHSFTRNSPDLDGGDGRNRSGGEGFPPGLQYVDECRTECCVDCREFKGREMMKLEDKGSWGFQWCCKERCGEVD